MHSSEIVRPCNLPAVLGVLDSRPLCERPCPTVILRLAHSPSVRASCVPRSPTPLVTRALLCSRDITTQYSKMDSRDPGSEPRPTAFNEHAPPSTSASASTRSDASLHDHTSTSKKQPAASRQSLQSEPRHLQLRDPALPPFEASLDGRPSAPALPTLSDQPATPPVAADPPNGNLASASPSGIDAGPRQAGSRATQHLPPLETSLGGRPPVPALPTHADRPATPSFAAGRLNGASADASLSGASAGPRVNDTIGRPWTATLLPMWLSALNAR